MKEPDSTAVEDEDEDEEDEPGELAFAMLDEDGEVGVEMAAAENVKTFAG